MGNQWFEKARLASLAAILTLGVGGTAAAQTLPNGNDDEWHFTIAPYLFLPVTTSGTATVAGAEADVDLDLGDVFDVLNMAASARAEAWYGDFGLMIDGYYTNLGGGGTVPTPGPGPGTISADVSIKQAWVAMMGAWRFYDGTYERGGAERRYAFDVGAGVRYNNLRQELEANADIGPGPGVQTKLGGTEVWWEPTFSLRAMAEVSENWTVAIRGEIGGFGAGGSDLQWLAGVGANYAAWDSVSLRMGWQFYGIDFSTDRSDGKFAYDVFQTGPYLGLAINF